MSSPANQFLEYTVGGFFSRQVQNRTPETLSVPLVPAPGVRIPIVRQLGATDRSMDESLAGFRKGTGDPTGTTVVVATHDVEMVNKMRRRVIELSNGRVVRDEQAGAPGAPRRVRQNEPEGCSGEPEPNPPSH